MDYSKDNILACNNRPSSRLEDQDNEVEGCPASAVVQSWKPVVLQPEYCGDFALICASYIEYGRKKTAYQNIDKLKRHLLHQGWRIEFKRDTMPRFRYLSPGGNNCYYSLNKVCCNLMDQKYRKDNNLERGYSNLEHPQLMTGNKNHAELSSRNIGLNSVREDVLKTEHTSVSGGMSEMEDYRTSLDSNFMLTSVLSVINEQACLKGSCSTSGKQNKHLQSISLMKGKEVYALEAIRKYVDSIENGQWKKDKVSIENAKENLKLSGWSLWLKDKKMKKELRYTSPNGKNYISLYTACKAFLEEHQNISTKNSTKSTHLVREFEAQSIAGKFVNSVEMGTNCTPCSLLSATNNDDLLGASHISHEGAEEGSRSSFPNICNRLLQKSSSKSSNNQKIRELKRKPNSKRHKRSGSRFSPCSLQSRTRSQLVVEPSTKQHISKTVLSWLIEKDVILPWQKVTYISKTDDHSIKHGRVTCDGIKCYCCDKVFSLSNFEAHAGCNTSRPAASIFLPDGKSLLQCQMQVVFANKPKYVPHVRMKRNCSQYEDDFKCSICCDGGNLLLCDHCPSAFHPDCVGLEDVPEGNWCCSSCQCRICDLSEFNCNTDQFTDESVLYCDQCEQGFHAGCFRRKGLFQLSSHPTGSWVCSKSCAKIFNHLQKLLGRSNPTTVEGLSWTILRSIGENGTDSFDDETIAEYHSKLYLALDVLHECFEPLIEPRTQSDVVADLLFNRTGGFCSEPGNGSDSLNFSMLRLVQVESEIRRLNFWGMYAIILESGDELISVATFRVYGEKVAEMPFIGTRFQYRCKGMCRLLVDELEKLLSALGVERLVLPAIPQALQIWTGSFGFRQMTKSDRMELLDYNLLSFSDSPMCQKFLRTPSKMCEECKG